MTASEGRRHQSMLSVSIVALGSVVATALIRHLPRPVPGYTVSSPRWVSRTWRSPPPLTCRQRGPPASSPTPDEAKLPDIFFAPRTM
jgi:hypothetical protein